MMKKNILVSAGFVTCLVVGGFALRNYWPGSQDAQPEPAGTMSVDNDAAIPFLPVVKAEAAPSLSAGTAEEVVNPWRNELQFQTHSMFQDVFRSTHIARGYVRAVSGGANVKVTFEPTTYLKGAPLVNQSVDLITGTNSNLSNLIGQEVVLGFIQRDDGTCGLTHGVHSLTPPGWGVETSVRFYNEFLAINAEYEPYIEQALEENPVGGEFDFPAQLVNEYSYKLIEFMGESGSYAALAAGRTLFDEAIFKDALTPDMLVLIHRNVVNSQPNTYDRGFGLMLMKRYDSLLLDMNEAASIIRDEGAKIILDHLAMYLANKHSHFEVTNALKEIYTNTEESDLARRNAIIVAAQFGSRLSLPSLHSLLGKETDSEIKRELLNSFRYLSDQSNFTPLMDYIIGKIPGSSETQRDVLESRNLYKRALLAMAVIDSPQSNMYMRQALTTVKPEHKWLKDFLVYLHPKNKDWRPVIEILDEDDIPVEE